MSILRYLKNMEIGVEERAPPPRNIRIIRLFTDGSEIKDKKTYKTLAVGWGFVIKDNFTGLCGKSSTVVHDSGLINDLQIGNNQRAELVAIHEGLKKVRTYIVDVLHDGTEVLEKNEEIELNIYTDSEYSMKCITTWSKTWERNGWMSSKKQPVKHQDIRKPLIATYKELSKMLGFNISINHVRSHTGKKDSISKGNEEADDLATNAARMYLFEKK